MPHEHISSLLKQPANSPEILEPQLDVHLVTTPTLRKIVYELKYHHKPDWIAISKKVKNATTASADPHQISGAMAEIDIRMFLEKSSRASQGSIVVDPIAHNSKTERFLFARTTENTFVVVDPQKQERIIEYDVLTVIDGIPVVWEVKSQIRKRSRNNKGKGHSLNEVLRIKHINQLFTPLQEYFDSKDFGYVVVATKEVIRPASPLQQGFCKNGGILIPHPASAAEFNLQALIANRTRP